MKKIVSFFLISVMMTTREDYYQIDSIVRESNFGDVPIPYHCMKDYMDYEVHRDTRTYLNGVCKNAENSGKAIDTT